MWNSYLCPRTVEEAVSALSGEAGQARVIAGGTDLVLQLQRGERQAACLVDVSGIAALQEISEAGGYILLGAAVTHSQVASSPLIATRVPLLAQAAGEVGSPEIRNVATLGGNVVNGQPAADTALALLALDSEARIVSAEGSRWVALSDLYLGAGESTVDSTSELLVTFRLRPPGGQTGSAYRRLGKCKSIALPVLCAATVVELEGGRFAAAAIALGPVAPRPFRAGDAETYLAGQPATPETIARAAFLARQESDPRASLLRCGREYREEMVVALVQSTLRQAVSAAQSAPESAL